MIFFRDQAIGQRGKKVWQNEKFHKAKTQEKEALKMQ